jgi:hypothetical protein
MKLGNSLAQEFKALANKIRLLDRNSGNVAGRMRQTLNQTAADRIERNGKDDRNARYCLPEDGNGAAIRDDDVNLAPLEFCGDFTDAIGSSRGPAILDRCSISLDPAEFPQMRDESGRPRTPYSRIRAQYSDEPLIPWLLRVGDQWPCANEATNDFDEFPPLHGFPP